MLKDEIIEISIKHEGKLYIKPKLKRFPYIFREAMEINWDSSELSLFSPAPKDWGYNDWTLQIFRAAEEQGCILDITVNTRWINISDDLKQELLKVIDTFRLTQS